MHPEWNSGWRSIWGTLCPGKTCRTGPQILRYFQEKILWTQFLALSIIIKASKPLAATICWDVCLNAHAPFAKIANIQASPLASSNSSQSSLRTVSQVIILRLTWIKISISFSDWLLINFSLQRDWVVVVFGFYFLY